MRKFETWRITATFYSPVVMIDPPMLDGLASWALEREANQGAALNWIVPRHDRVSDGIRRLPEVIYVAASGLPWTTRMQFDGAASGLDSWKKRWRTRYSKHADFRGAKRRVNVKSEAFRSHNMPLPTLTIREGWWYVRGDGPRLLELLKDQVWGVGKKVSEGFGVVREWRLESANLVDYEILSLRPVPERLARVCGLTGRLRKCAWRPPYWDKRNVEECVV